MSSFIKALSESFKIEQDPGGITSDDENVDDENNKNGLRALSDWIPPPPPELPDYSDQMGDSTKPGHNSQCKKSQYGQPLNSEQIMEIMGPANDNEGHKSAGLTWRAIIVPDDFDVNFEKNGHLKMITANHYDAKNKCIKPRRGNLTVKQSDFFSSLTKLEGYNRWVFSGVLNGWPGLQCLELEKIEYKTTLPKWRTHWENDNESGDPPTYTTKGSKVRAKLRAPSWTADGWTKDSPGYLYWYESPASRKIPRVLYGTNTAKTFVTDISETGKASAKCVKVHMVSHRYSTGKSENVKDKLTYHSLALLEWDHGLYCTVAEVGFMNGLSGYNGRSNWIEDRDEEIPSMLKYIPPEMVAPWRTELLECRCLDVHAKNLEQFLAFMKRHTGKDKRFIDVHVSFSHEVRLFFSSREHIAQYLLNYVWRGRSYSEINNNCQTFTADFCAFLAGKKDVQPFHIVNRIDYTNHAYHFLYDGRHWK